MSDAELEAKFRSLAGRDADECRQWLESLERQDVVRLPSAL